MGRPGLLPSLRLRGPQGRGLGPRRAGSGSLLVTPGLVTKADGERGWLPKPLEAQECGEGSSWPQVWRFVGEFAFISRRRPHGETFYGLAAAPGPEHFHQAACEGHWPAGSRDHGALRRQQSPRGSAGRWATEAETGAWGDGHTSQRTSRNLRVTALSSRRRAVSLPGDLFARWGLTSRRRSHSIHSGLSGLSGGPGRGSETEQSSGLSSSCLLGSRAAGGVCRDLQ